MALRNHAAGRVKTRRRRKRLKQRFRPSPRSRRLPSALGGRQAGPEGTTSCIGRSRRQRTSSARWPPSARRRSATSTPRRPQVPREVVGRGREPVRQAPSFGALVLVMKHAHEVGHISDNPASRLCPATPPRRPGTVSVAPRNCAPSGKPVPLWAAGGRRPVPGRHARPGVYCQVDDLGLDRHGRQDDHDPRLRREQGRRGIRLAVDRYCDGNHHPSADAGGLVFRGRSGGPVSLGSDVKDRLDEVSGVDGLAVPRFEADCGTLLADHDHDIDVDAATDGCSTSAPASRPSTSAVPYRVHA